MKNLIQVTLVIVSTLFLFSCSSSSKEDTAYAKQLQIESGKKIFNGKGNCASCHDVYKELVGPSLKVIASVYSKNGNMIDFFKQKTTAKVVPGHAEGMKDNFPILAKMSDEELQSLQAYILNVK